MTAENDTIAAIATGLTPAGIGIIRISGPESYAVLNRIFTNKKGRPCDLSRPNRIHYGFLHVSRETLDEVLVMNMKAPHSYTGEDTVEINCHGGPTVMRKVLEAVLENGARAAEPGEFTKRAFLNGRIDLTQAEAVMDLISAKNERAVYASTRQLKGSVSEGVKALRDRILQQTAYIEAALDDPEHYELEGFGTELKPELEDWIRKTERLAASYETGKLVKEGVNTCILGKPNAGKSSLLNALLGEERAIVTEIPGTTRDVIRESFTAEGLTFQLMDTAGIRETADPVEKLGVDAALRQAEEADLILYVIDAALPLDASDRKILGFLREHGKRTVCLLNKTDLLSTEPEALEAEVREALGTGAFGGPVEAGSTEVGDALAETTEPASAAGTGGPPLLKICARNGEGLEALPKLLGTLFSEGLITYNEEILITSKRQQDCLRRANAALRRVAETIELGLPEDFYTIDLMDAYHQLGLILGEETEDDLCDRIFSQFCMGK